MEEEKRYKKGDVVPETNLYKCTTCKVINKTVRERLKQGENFPDCKECADKEITEWQKAPSDLDMPASLHL